jgi:2-polyprenyl-3-methyl-5-hydroxy-6-metoxy-1,4-benzoquinol methylase
VVGRRAATSAESKGCAAVAFWFKQSRSPLHYRPREFWDERLRRQFDLRGTGEPELSTAYNQACYDLRRETLAQVLREESFDPAGKEILDVGCGSGFFTDFYVQRAGRVTGMDIAPTSIERLSARHPRHRFILADVSEQAPPGRYDLVNAFDVLYHITDEQRWSDAVRHLAEAVKPGGLLLITDTFLWSGPLEEHNRMRLLGPYEEILRPLGFTWKRPRPTHVLLNRELGAWRFINRFPGLLLAIDRGLLRLKVDPLPRANRLLVARRSSDVT